MKFSKLVLLSISVKLIFVAICGIILLTMTPVKSQEPIWKLQVHFGNLNETICAHYNFDTEDSCVRTKNWFDAVTEWHGRNKYQCILDTECPKE